MIDDILEDARRHMETSLSVLDRDLKAMRTGRAHVSLIENLPVEAYGSTMPLIGLAGLSVPDARLLVIQPYDKNTILDIERAIMSSSLGITPSNDGTVIRLPFPQLTEERRRDLVRVVRRRVEDAKVAVRNIRRDSMDDLRQAETEKLCSQDEARKGSDELQSLTDEFVEKITQTGKLKEADVLEV